MIVAPKFKFKKTSEDSYEVSLNGQVLGEVYKSWHRLGGQGWTFKEKHYSQMGRTRYEAAYYLWQLRKKEEKR